MNLNKLPRSRMLLDCLPIRLLTMANAVRHTVSVSPATSKSGPGMQPSKSPSPSQPGSNSAKTPDYVYFDRTTAGFSDAAIPRAKNAQLRLEHYYKVAVDAAIERNTR